MKRSIFIFLSLLFTITTFARNYTLVVEGFDWGPGASKVILPLDGTSSEADASDFQVTAYRSTDARVLSAEEAEGPRLVLDAWVSDADGNPVSEGSFITLALLVGPKIPLGQLIEYMPCKETGRHRSQWLDYRLEVIAPDLGQKWTEEGKRIRPVVDDFILDQRYEYAPGKKLSYAYFKPETGKGKRPLLIWLHGGGEGGTDTSVPLMANKAANYASPEIQQIFDGAWVLAPQSPTFWMQNKEGGYNRGEGNDIYNEGLMMLIRDFVKEHDQIDPGRIYIGGCSNGGYMSLKLILNDPDYFAGAYISCLAYHAEYLSDADILSIKDVPIWFVHSADDGTTVPEYTVIPVYKRLNKAGASNVHLSLYDRVIDQTGIYGGKDFHYYGHSSWTYSHNNHCRLDYDGSTVKIDGRPVSLLEWLAAQRN